MVKDEVKLLSKVSMFLSIVLLSITTILFLILSSAIVKANDPTTASVSVTVSASCNMTSTIDSNHTATINSGTYKTDIGTTTLKVVCNDSEGYSIYAIGYSNEEYGNNKLLATVGGTLTPTNDILTGTTTSGNTSSWSMKIDPVSNAFAPTIENGFNAYRTVPDLYTKIATLSSNTDISSGSSIKATYASYISGTQPAGTYEGKVRYTMVHPNDGKAPEDPRFVASLDTGQTVNQKLKRLAGNSSASYETEDNNITALVRSDTLPSDFTPTTENTISTTASGTPIYAWYDSSNKTIYYYSEATTIKMNQDSSYFFNGMRALSDLSTISSWDTYSVTNMSYMFNYAGRNATTFTLDLSSWDTSSVTDMSVIFQSAGRNATTFTLDLSSWDTSSVTNMSYMFNYAGSRATTWSVGDLSSWDTSSVTNMVSMFAAAGFTATTFTLDLSSWDTSSVTSIYNMFYYAGSNATNWSVTIPKTNKGSTPITNTTTRFYGNATSVYAEPLSDKTFTLAD